MSKSETEPFTIGVYEDKWAYLRLLALAASELVSDHIVEKVRILWYRLDHTLHTWTHEVEAERGDMFPTPFGQDPFGLELGPGAEDLLLPGEGRSWTGQPDIPEDLIAESPTPGKFWIVRDDPIPEPNLCVVDHELFRHDTAFVTCAGTGNTGGHAHLILKGLQEYYDPQSRAHTPPIFLSSIKSLGGLVGIDTLGIDDNRDSRVRWFPRPEEAQPERLPNNFTEALREEAAFWQRNQDVLTASRTGMKSRRYSPPFEHIAIFYDKDELTLTGDITAALDVVSCQSALSADQDGHAVIAHHCKAYLEYRKEITQSDVDRLRKLARRFPLPIVLLYWNTAPGVSSLVGSGIMVQRVESSLNSQVTEAVNEWVQRMRVLDTVVGGHRLRDIRDDLLHWRLGAQASGQSVNKTQSGGRAILVVGPTGAGKMAVSKWCHFFSNHIKRGDNNVRDLWQDIHVPKPGKEYRGQAEPLSTAFKEGKTEYLCDWADKLIRHGGKDPHRILRKDRLQTAFETTNMRPWLVNLVGITQPNDFIMQIIGAYPSWTDSKWPDDWRPGAILNATNNSLILNEIGELESAAQGLLLELVERGGPARPLFAPIRGEVDAKNVLFIMATDRVDKIRKQLLHRCRVVRVPSLLECKQDIPELARHRLLPRWRCLSEDAERLLECWPYWPGNHRSLHAVLDFAAELPSYQRVIQVPDVVRALWREGLIRIPDRLESLIKMILDWPELISCRQEEAVLPKVTARLTDMFSREGAESDWAKFLEDLNRIGVLSFEKPSKFFTGIISKLDRTDKGKLISIAMGLFVHEIFWTMEKRAGNLFNAIDSAAETRAQELHEIADTDFEPRLVKELLDDAGVILSLGTLLGLVLRIQPAEIKEANDLIKSQPPKASGRPKGVKDGGSDSQTDATGPSDKVEAVESGTADADKEKTTKESDIPRFDVSKISDTFRWAAQYTIAVFEAADSSSRGSLFDYVESRRNRGHFSSRQNNEDDEEESDMSDLRKRRKPSHSRSKKRTSTRKNAQ